MKKEIEVKDMLDSCFISRYSNHFTDYLQKLSPETRDIIRKNKELDQMYDLFLDFILDSNNHLDYIHAKNQEKQGLD